MSGFVRQQLELNAGTRNSWDLFRGHRQKVTGLLRAGSAPGPARLCVLGAGNCNDLDLPTLLGVYKEVHLADVDAEALLQGTVRQQLGDSPAVQRHGGIDLSGAYDILAAWSPQNAIPDPDLARCRDEPVRRVAPALPGPFECVASTALLTQLIKCAVATVGETHPRFLEVVQAIRAGHLRLLTHLVAPGGTGVLITDIVSSDTFPGLGSVPEDSLAGVLARLIQDRNFFHGVNPAVLAAFFSTDPIVAPQVERMEFIKPWLWDLGPRVYVVCSLKFRKLLPSLRWQ